MTLVQRDGDILTITIPACEAADLYRALRLTKWDSTQDAQAGHLFEETLDKALTEEEKDP